MWLGPSQDLPTLLGEAIERVADDHRSTCDLTDPSSPSATVAILRLSGGRGDYLVLGDSVLVLDLTLLRAHGPAEIIRRVREAEMRGPRGASLPTALDPDDATIATASPWSMI